MNHNNFNGPKSSTGLDENIAGLLCYLGAWVTGLIFFFLEKESRFVKFHAMQSIIASVILTVAGIVLGLLPIIWRLTSLIGLAQFVIMVICMIKAYNREWFKLPIVGDIAEEQINK
ncbi:DUF4870 domain-containing protein [Clostridium thermarum]|uniref:DUF4870 domain-containing protein n=1 Tax=Clostridium thermarum TaxID=1716543 RepID=UPI0011231B32|nr:DUF4870 domain-containing protein [Clostridium thermarum]